MCRAVGISFLVVLVAVAACNRNAQTLDHREAAPPVQKTQNLKVPLRLELLKQLQPIKLSNCELRRFGEANDGGYLLCGNLLGGVKAGYSYGISGYDGWGCEISRELKVKVHEYDCFDLTVPACRRGATVFHGECVGAAASTDKDGRTFDSLEHQLANNGDGSNHVVMKMDVEGAEWDTFLASPDSLFERIDQLAVELHGSGEERFVRAVEKLKRFFYVANLHFNNYSCDEKYAPFPSWAYEVLFVNKRLATVDPSGAAWTPSPLNAPNKPDVADCQTPR